MRTFNKRQVHQRFSNPLPLEHFLKWRSGETHGRSRRVFDRNPFVDFKYQNKCFSFSSNKRAYESMYKGGKRKISTLDGEFMFS